MQPSSRLTSSERCLWLEPLSFMHHVDEHHNLTYLGVGPSLFSIHPIRILGSSGTELGNAWMDWQANGQNFTARSAAALTESLRCSGNIPHKMSNSGEQPLISSVSEARATYASLHPFQAHGRVVRQKPAHDHAAEVDGVKSEVDMFNQDLVGHRHGVQFDGGLSTLPSAWHREGTTSRPGGTTQLRPHRHLRRARWFLSTFHPYGDEEATSI